MDADASCCISLATPKTGLICLCQRCFILGYSEPREPIHRYHRITHCIPISRRSRSSLLQSLIQPLGAILLLFFEFIEIQGNIWTRPGSFCFLNPFFHCIEKACMKGGHFV